MEQVLDLATVKASLDEENLAVVKAFRTNVEANGHNWENVKKNVRSIFLNADLKKAVTGCTFDSFMRVCVDASILGFCPGDHNNHVYIVKFGTTATLIVSYQGMLDILARYGMVVTSGVVYERDTYKIDLADREKPIIHNVNFGDRGNVIGYWALGDVKGNKVLEIMNAADVDKLKKNAKTDKFWGNHTTEMGRKTVIRRLFKHIKANCSQQQQQQINKLEQVDNKGYIDIQADISEQEAQAQVPKQTQSPAKQIAKKTRAKKAGAKKTTAKATQTSAQNAPDPSKDNWEDRKQLARQDKIAFLKRLLDSLGYTHNLFLSRKNVKTFDQVSGEDLDAGIKALEVKANSQGIDVKNLLALATNAQSTEQPQPQTKEEQLNNQINAICQSMGTDRYYWYLDNAEIYGFDANISVDSLPLVDLQNILNILKEQTKG